MQAPKLILVQIYKLRKMKKMKKKIKGFVWGQTLIKSHASNQSLFSSYIGGFFWPFKTHNYTHNSLFTKRHKILIQFVINFISQIKDLKLED